MVHKEKLYWGIMSDVLIPVMDYQEPGYLSSYHKTILDIFYDEQLSVVVRQQR